MAEDLSLNVTRPDESERISRLVTEIANKVDTPFSVEFGMDSTGRFAKIRAETNEEHGARKPVQKGFSAPFPVWTKDEIVRDLMDCLDLDDGTVLTDDEYDMLVEFLVGQMTDGMAQSWVDEHFHGEQDWCADDRFGRDTFFDMSADIDQAAFDLLLPDRELPQ